MWTTWPSENCNVETPSILKLWLVSLNCTDVTEPWVVIEMPLPLP